MRYNLLLGRKEFQVIQQVCKLMERISVLEQEAATSQGTITSLQEQQSSVNKVIEEHVAEKKRVRITVHVQVLYTQLTPLFICLSVCMHVYLSISYMYPCVCLCVYLSFCGVYHVCLYLCLLFMYIYLSYMAKCAHAICTCICVYVLLYLAFCCRACV